MYVNPKTIYRSAGVRYSEGVAKVLSRLLVLLFFWEESLAYAP